MEEDSTSSIQENNSPQPGISILVPATKNITPLDSVSEHTNKRDLSDIIDTEAEDMAKTPKNKTLEEAGKLV